MALRLQALVQGEVRIRVMGDRAAFLSAAAERGLPLYDIAYLGEDIAVTLALKDVRRLKAVCHAAHCRFRPLRRRGWPFLMRHIVRRPLLIIGALLVLGLRELEKREIISLDAVRSIELGGVTDTLFPEPAADSSLTAE